MKRIIAVAGVVATIVFACSSKKDEGSIITPPQGVTDKNWTFETTPTWADEFDYTGLPDNTKWDYDLGGSGWGNNELEYYTNSINNGSVGSGVLTITARKESMGGRNYTSARLVTRNKGDWTYGRFEIKAKLPSGKGTWPAIWMLPTDRAYGEWPNSGEFDIMEHVGYDPNNIHVSAHTGKYNFKLGNQKTATTIVSTAMTDFHVYRVDWTPYAMRGYVDDKLLLTYVNEGSGSPAWPYDKRFHLLLNVAVGGDWGGQQGIDDNIFPATMVVDYVRVYKMIDK